MLRPVRVPAVRIAQHVIHCIVEREIDIEISFIQIGPLPSQGLNDGPIHAEDRVKFPVWEDTGLEGRDFEAPAYDLQFGRG